jgi:hypothetical protein
MYLIVGPLVGLFAFLIGVVTMEGVVFRKNSENKVVFCPMNVVNYFMLPFSRTNAALAWGLLPNITFEERLKLWNLNWIIMVSSSTLFFAVFDDIILSQDGEFSKLG